MSSLPGLRVNLIMSEQGKPLWPRAGRQKIKENPPRPSNSVSARKKPQASQGPRAEKNRRSYLDAHSARSGSRQAGGNAFTHARWAQQGGPMIPFQVTGSPLEKIKTSFLRYLPFKTPCTDRVLHLLNRRRVRSAANNHTSTRNTAGLRGMQPVGHLPLPSLLPDFGIRLR